MKHPLFFSLIFMALILGGAAHSSRAGNGDGREAPYVGQYTLDQGGTDAAGRINLLLMPGGDYAIVYFGGMQQGTWKVLPDGRLELREWPADPADFQVFGRHTPTLGNEVRLQFEGFIDTYAKIGLVGAGQQGELALHPVFNDDANCFQDSYSIKRPAGQLTALQLALYQEPARAQYRQVPFTKKLLYTFPLDKRYNDYQVVHFADASRPTAIYVGQVVNKKLTLYPAAAHQQGAPGDSYGERRPLSATDVADIGLYIKQARQPFPDKLTVRQKSDDVTLTYQKVASKSQPLPESRVQLLKPLFIARCE